VKRHSSETLNDIFMKVKTLSHEFRAEQSRAEQSRAEQSRALMKESVNNL